MPAFLVGLAINLAIQIGLNILSRLLEPKKKRDKPAPFAAPTASSGQPLGKGFGIYESQPTVMYVRGRPANEKHGDLDIVRYYVKMNLALGWGPIDILYDIITDDRSIGSQKPDPLQSLNGEDPNIIGPLRVPTAEFPNGQPTLPWDFLAPTSLSDAKEFSINVRQIFGGGGEEGGLQGLLMLYRGVFDQPIDPMTLEQADDTSDNHHPEFASGYPWLVYARLGAQVGKPEGLSNVGLNQQGEWFYISTGSPTPKGLSFLLGSYPNLLLEDNGRMGKDANPIEVIYELYTDRKWGAKKPTSRFDVAQWQEKAAFIRDEALCGISIPRDDPRTLDDLVDDILTHIDGGIVEDPVTGLLQIKLARADYDIDDLLTINASNSDNIKRGKPLAPKSLNDIQIRYRRFHGGVTGNIQNEIATKALPLWYFQPTGNPWDPSFGTRPNIFVYNGAGDNLIEGSTHAYVDDVEIPVNETGIYNDGDLCVVDLETGVWKFWIYWQTDPTPFAAGSEIKVSYAANPSYIAFVDDVVVSQNLANQQGRGQQQPESFDYTFFTNPLSAQNKADRLQATMSRSLDTFTWEGKKDQEHLTPWDVVKLLEPAWGVTEPIAIRITKRTGGTRTNPQLVFEGVKDVWGEQIWLSNTDIQRPPTTGRLPAPPMAIACGIGPVEEGMARIDLFPTSFVYDVQVWEATDELGTGASMVAVIPAGTSPMYYNGFIGTFYAAQQVSSSTTPGPLTPWITCDGDGNPPECTLPTFTYEADELTGIVVLTIIDPQHRVQLVEYRSRSGNGVWSDWNVSTEPYCFSVILQAAETSRIEWRITYQDCDGSTKILTGGHDFVPFVPPPPPPPEPPSDVVQECEVVLHAGGPAAVGIDAVEDPGGGRIPLTPWRSAEVRTPIVWATNAVITASIERSDIPLLEDAVSAYLVIRGRVPNEVGVWSSLGLLDTPRLPLHAATLIAMDDESGGVMPVCVIGDPVDIRLELLGAPLHLAADVVGIDGTVLQENIFTRLSVWLRKQPVVVEPPEPPDVGPPPDVDPGSCDIGLVLDDFTYASTGALDAVWPVT